MIQILLTAIAGIAGYLLSRSFVRRRLRFVDAVYSPLAPLIAGVVAAILVWPLALLPAVTPVTVILFGIGTALGTASGVRALRHADTEHRRLRP
jgi:hypothetical protein